ncbi:hypothetical protein COLINT_03336 [Collinsella intestinalis DSM 13280]|uniref:SRCR domain-containing protein n=1 Tax=Collinsella intestinalis DSM 13280 TaxID=521003 RepID=C4FB83_9ACTN|nr:hypothetical protein COLINT_03336 [Collinsella intestinalis DSM 13280]
MRMGTCLLCGGGAVSYMRYMRLVYGKCSNRFRVRLRGRGQFAWGTACGAPGVCMREMARPIWWDWDVTAWHES